MNRKLKMGLLLCTLTLTMVGCSGKKKPTIDSTNGSNDSSNIEVGVIPHTHVSWADYEYDENYHYHVCQFEGCNEIVDKELHIYEDEILEEATDKKKGRVKHTCKICGYSYEEDCDPNPKEEALFQKCLQGFRDFYSYTGKLKIYEDGNNGYSSSKTYYYLDTEKNNLKKYYFFVDSEGNETIRNIEEVYKDGENNYYMKYSPTDTSVSTKNVDDSYSSYLIDDKMPIFTSDLNINHLSYYGFNKFLEEYARFYGYQYGKTDENREFYVYDSYVDIKEENNVINFEFSLQLRCLGKYISGMNYSYQFVDGKLSEIIFTNITTDGYKIPTIYTITYGDYVDEYSEYLLDKQSDIITHEDETSMFYTKIYINNELYRENDFDCNRKIDKLSFFPDAYEIELYYDKEMTNKVGEDDVIQSRQAALGLYGKIIVKDKSAVLVTKYNRKDAGFDAEYIYDYVEYYNAMEITGFKIYDEEEYNSHSISNEDSIKEVKFEGQKLELNEETNSYVFSLTEKKIYTMQVSIVLA